MGRRRVDLQEAAELLGISSDAVRKRAKRGTIPYETGADGKLYVWVDAGRTRADRGGPDLGDHDRFVQSLEDQIAFLRRELEAERSAHGETRQLAAMLAARVQAIEPSEATEAPPEAAEPRPSTDAPADATGAQEGAQTRRPSWWRRFFGG